MHVIKVTGIMMALKSAQGDSWQPSYIKDLISKLTLIGIPLGDIVIETDLATQIEVIEALR